MNFSSLLISIFFHTCVFLSITIFFDTESRQKNKIQYDLISFHIIENKFFEKQKENKNLSNKKLKSYRTKNVSPIQNLLKKKQSDNTLTSKFQSTKVKNFEFKKKVIKEVKLSASLVKKKINKNKSVIKNKFFNEKQSMSVIPNIDKFRGTKLNQRFHTCSKKQRSKYEIKNNKDTIVNKNVTISNLLGNFYNYNPHLINISNLLKTNKRTDQKNINISELINSTIDNKINCN